MAKLVSRRYSSALFEIALESNKLDLFEEQVKYVYNSLKNNSEFLKVIDHPQISENEKMKMFKEIFKDSISYDILGLFSLVLRKNREAEILEILEDFTDRVKKHKGIITAFVYSAKALKGEQINSIKLKLSQNLNKQVIIQAEVQPELIGGIRIVVGGHVIDGSIKKQLDELKKQLLNVQLA